MKKTIAILIDGGFLRSLANKAKLTYDPDFIASFAASCATDQEEIFRILYYDCAPFVGDAKLPVSGTIREFKGDSRWLDELAAKDFFAIRRGVLKFRGFQPKDIPIARKELTDTDFRPDFEQKESTCASASTLPHFPQTSRSTASSSSPTTPIASPQ